MLNLLQLLYELPGYLIPLYLSLLAFFKIEGNARFFFLAAVVFLYAVPPLIFIPLPGAALLGLRVLLGIVGYLTLTYKRISLKFWE